MAGGFGIGQNMTAPQLVVIVQRGGVAQDLSAAATVVRLYVGAGGTMGRVLNGVTMVKDPLVLGKVTHTFTGAQTVNPGEYLGQLQITWAAGVVEASEVFAVSIQPIV
jgi:hypothetical protein